MPLHLAVGRNRDDVELVDLPELAGLGHGRAGHAADLVVQLEEVLQRDRGQRLRLFLDLHPFLGLDRLVQAVAPLPALHFAAGELIDDDDRVVLDDVLHVALVEVMGLERVVDQVRPLHVAGRVEALDAGQPLRLAHAFVGQVDRVVLLVDLEVHRPSSAAGRCGRPWRTCAGLSCAGPEMISGVRASSIRMLSTSSMIAKCSVPLRLLQVLGIAVVAAGRGPHVVAQIVEAEFVVRAVGDVAVVGLLPLAARPCCSGSRRPSGPGPGTAGPSTPCRGGPDSR